MIYSNSRYLSITNSGPPSPYINMAAPSAGMVRYNGNSNILETYDGSSWVTISSYQSIEFSNETNSLLEWVQKKREEEAKIRSLCEKYPALQKAYDNFEMIKAMVENENYSTAV